MADSEPTFNETLLYGNRANPWEINPQTERLFAAGRETRVLPGMILMWESAVIDWAGQINPKEKTDHLKQIDMPENVVEITQDLAKTAVRAFGIFKWREDEAEAVARTVGNELHAFFPDEWYIGQEQMDDFLDRTVISPVATLVHYRHVLSDIRSGGVEAIK